MAPDRNIPVLTRGLEDTADNGTTSEVAAETGPLDSATGLHDIAEPPRGEGDPMPAREDIMALLQARGMPIIDMSGYTSADGHYYAARVIAGGRPDGETVFAGHGIWVFNSGTTTVPEGTRITFYVADGLKLPGLNGLAVEAGIYPEDSFFQTFEPGQTIPNYTLLPPDRLSVMENSAAVGESTTLSELLRPGMGSVHWAACRETVHR